MATVLTVKFLNTSDPNLISDMYWDLDLLARAVKDLNYEETGQHSFKIDCLQSFYETTKKGQSLISFITPILFERFPSVDDGKESLQELRDLIEAMQAKIDKASQKFVFAFTPMPKIYSTNLFKRRDITFEPINSKLDPNPVFYYDIFMPFHRNDYRERDPCTPGNQLPLYFRLIR